jgi:hypothetical protein
MNGAKATAPHQGTARKRRQSTEGTVSTKSHAVQASLVVSPRPSRSKTAHHGAICYHLLGCGTSVHFH